ncbi:exopolysaccharide biosynthesis protein [Tateyamaria omphalii]|uniref:exopolysaccharide biosynthesis protein n=1 Tax=Tateyamaria omphalii TaxID=299262 RepID=UPI001C99485C|nr:exopolysaccharide biosynthesis protein [Tateyamaria omphalii]MBY5933481.1 exopolysaccharide biosynthesis protein [Tateyamaria omphalii]
MTLDDERTLNHLLDALNEAGDGHDVSVQDILDEIGERSIMPVVLAVSILLVSPLSGIPGMPTLSAIVLILLIGQALAGRKHLWLPGFLSRRRLARARLQVATSWLRRPATWFDTHSHPRLRPLARNPLRKVALLLCMAIPLTWPFLELLPFMTSFGAGAVALLAFGLVTRDGYFLLAGYAVTFGILYAGIFLVQAAT